ncbi:hypothetical protein [Methanobrevibacter arboriphilus]|uniref:hypothetical protein n=1 Tax=Methanobrevibacter arboriphilus TaxID=39441 RepID=UPI000AA5E28A|nr:hypothetical protein [Methanobrevibacter arboriphilus]
MFALMDKLRTPSKISKSTNIKMSHISTILKELSDKNLIKCLNPQKKTRKTLYYYRQRKKKS